MVSRFSEARESKDGSYLKKVLNGYGSRALAGTDNGYHWHALLVAAGRLTTAALRDTFAKERDRLLHRDPLRPTRVP